MPDFRKSLRHMQITRLLPISSGSIDIKGVRIEYLNVGGTLATVTLAILSNNWCLFLSSFVTPTFAWCRLHYLYTQRLTTMIRYVDHITISDGDRSNGFETILQYKVLPCYSHILLLVWLNCNTNTSNTSQGMGFKFSKLKSSKFFGRTKFEMTKLFLN